MYPFGKVPVTLIIIYNNFNKSFLGNPRTQRYINTIIFGKNPIVKSKTGEAGDQKNFQRKWGTRLIATEEDALEQVLSFIYTRWNARNPALAAKMHLGEIIGLFFPSFWIFQLDGCFLN